jgi:histone H3/H4
MMAARFKKYQLAACHAGREHIMQEDIDHVNAMLESKVHAPKRAKVSKSGWEFEMW